MYLKTTELKFSMIIFIVLVELRNKYKRAAVINHLCCQFFCRNYHVFYYLLAGTSPEEKEELHLTKPEEYCYLNQVSTNWRAKKIISDVPAPSGVCIHSREFYHPGEVFWGET